MMRRTIPTCVMVVGSMVIGGIITSTILFQFLWCTSVNDEYPNTWHNKRSSLTYSSSSTQEKCLCGEELVALLKRANSGGDGGGGGGVKLKKGKTFLEAKKFDAKPVVMDTRKEVIKYRTISLPCGNDTVTHSDNKDRLHVSIAVGEGGPPIWPEAVYETWGRDSSNILFFVRNSYNFNHSSSTGLPIVRIDSLHNKSSSSSSSSFFSGSNTLSILRHVTSRYSETYHWFMLATENSYVRIDKLKLYLTSLNPDDQIYLGRSASGKQEDQERLGMKPHERYCLGNSGIVLSRGLLLSLRDHLDGCIESEHGNIPGDVGLGKCISRTLNIQCTQEEKIRNYFFEDYSGRRVVDRQVINSNPNIFSSLISYHPVPTSESMYLLHHAYKTAEFKGHLNKVNSIKKQLMEICEVHNFSPNCVPVICEGVDDSRKCPNAGEIKTLRSPYRPTTIYDYQPWQYFDVNNVYHDQTVQPSYKLKMKKNYKNELQQALTRAVQKASERYGKTLKLRQLVNGWVRHNPFIGNEFIFDLFVMNGNRKKFTTRVSLVQPLASNYMVVKDTADTAVFINMIVPITKVNQRFSEFMEMYESLALKTKERVRLVLPVYGDSDVAFVNKVLGSYILKYPWANITVLAGKGKFSRGKALHYGITHLKEDDLIFVCDVDMVVTLPFFERCRRNTVQRSRVYYPEFFKLYNLDYVYWNMPHPSKVTLKREHGHWAYYSFGMLCIYKSDYDSVGGMDTTIAGWGDEDVHFFQKVVRRRLDVIRSPDTGLSHRWHDKICPKTLTSKQHKHCLSSQQENLADRKELARYVYELGVNIKGKGREKVPIFTNNMTIAEEEDDEEEDYNF